MPLNWAEFSWLDFIFVGIVSISVIVSLWRGFVQEAMSLLGWVAAFVASILFSDLVANALAGAIENESARHVAAYVLIFIAVLVLANFAAYVLKQLVKLTGLSLFDRVLGTVFGFARGIIVILVLVLLARELAEPEQLEWMRDSQLMPHVDLLVAWVESVFGELDFGWVPGLSSRIVV